MGAAVANSPAHLSISAHHGDAIGRLVIADRPHDPFVCRRCVLDVDIRSFPVSRLVERTRAIEDDPDLSVGIREAPGESDQAFATFPTPPPALSPGLAICAGVPAGPRVAGRLAVPPAVGSELGAQDPRVEGVVAIHEPESGDGQGRLSRCGTQVTVASSRARLRALGRRPPRSDPRARHLDSPLLPPTPGSRRRPLYRPLYRHRYRHRYLLLYLLLYLLRKGRGIHTQDRGSPPRRPPRQARSTRSHP
jgi:hypothetical protein